MRAMRSLSRVSSGNDALQKGKDVKPGLLQARLLTVLAPAQATSTATTIQNTTREAMLPAGVGSITENRFRRPRRNYMYDRDFDRA